MVAGINLYNNSGQTIDSCSFLNNGVNGIYLNSSSPIISNSIIKENTDMGIYHTGSAHPSISNSIITGLWSLNI